ncbi:mitotic spindle assembly checkpoint protein MAD2A-like [Limulus polyphemus]|uniref:Mitotic spindle assembly checkpoint protein MAD2A-like n=1 Tax=Limulus polyphemus TaxID=6850 RepID=A0ABM1BEY8_LIMPO|nr:mitotic spindle assembly checkpoint protein MAD2A-like [Limulus polyphemus]
MANVNSANAVTLKGSADIVSEFFNYGINSILYQRGIYPPESFTRLQKYGLTLLVTTNDKLQHYLSIVLKQLREWLISKDVHRLVVVISNIDTKETLERWEFKIECDKDIKTNSKPKQKDIKEIQNEIKGVIRQITASVTFLPLLEVPCAFDLLIFMGKEAEVPNEWAESPPYLIPDSEEVQLRSFSTSIHKVDTAVTYKNTE